MENNQPTHPVFLQVKNFLSDVLTEGELVARSNAILSLVPHDFILEAAEQIKAYRANSENKVKPE